MSQHARFIAAITLAFPIVFLGEALAKEGAPLSPPGLNDAGYLQTGDSTLNQELAALRQVTAHLHRFENAAPAGWDVQLTPCLELPAVGGMGFHYGNMDFVLDGEAKVLEPDVLLYEPQPNGRLRLVAVEYIAPVPLEESPGVAPRLFGRDLHWDEDLHAWLLHVWIWKHNPAGLFEDWNPSVSCEFAE